MLPYARPLTAATRSDIGKGATGAVRYTSDGRAIIEPTLHMRYEDMGVFRGETRTSGC